MNDQTMTDCVIVGGGFAGVAYTLAVTATDPRRHSVTLADGKTVTGDILGLAAGAQPNFFRTPGAAEFAFPLYSLADAKRVELMLGEPPRLGLRARGERHLEANQITIKLDPAIGIRFDLEAKRARNLSPEPIDMEMELAADKLTADFGGWRQPWVAS